MDPLAPSVDDQHLADVLHALGHPLRLAILRYIASHPDCICNDLVLRFGRAQATMSQHLATLRRAHLLIAERDGQAVCYRIDADHISWLQTRLDGITQQ